MGEIFIYRKSIQNKKGCCPECGVKVIGSDGAPTDNVGVDDKFKNSKEFVLLCANCHRKGIGTILGTCKIVSDSVIDASRMYSGADYEKYEKAINKDLINREKDRRTKKELQEEIRKLKFQNDMLKGNMESLKRKHEKEIKELCKKNDKMYKDYKELEAQYKKLGGDV